MLNHKAQLQSIGDNTPETLQRDIFPRIIVRKEVLISLIALLITATIIGGCTSDSEDTTTGTNSEESADNADSTEESADNADDGTAHLDFDPDNFVDPTTSTNQYHPLRPGMQWVRTGTTEVGSREVPLQVISTMTDVIRLIDGVPTVAMLDQSTDSGEISQVGIDYFALDKDGNVWLMGGYSEEYEGGEYTNLEVAWLGTETGGQPGVLMPGVVTMDTPRWYIGTSGDDEDPSAAEPVAVGIETTVEFGDFQNVIAILEGHVEAIENEIKYYAPGVGVILNEPQDASLHQDRFELVNLIELSPEGLAEASQVVLDLEAHALEEAPEVFGSAPPAKRAQ